MTLNRYATVAELRRAVETGQTQGIPLLDLIDRCAKLAFDEGWQRAINEVDRIVQEDASK